MRHRFEKVSKAVRDGLVQLLLSLAAPNQRETKQAYVFQFYFIALTLCFSLDWPPAPSLQDFASVCLYYFYLSFLLT